MDKAGLLPRGGEYVEFKNTFRRQKSNSVSLFTRTRQGTANTKTIKVVCKNCNSGWMGDLETAVQPYLTPLIKGEPIILDFYMRQILIEWIVMKNLVAENNSYIGHPADPIFDQAARTAFMESRAIPAQFHIWIASQDGTKWVTGYNRHASGLSVTATLPPPPQPPNRPKNVQVVTWGIGKLLIHLNATTDADVYPWLEIDSVGPFRQLWPLDPTNIGFSFPLSIIVGDAFMDDLADVLERLINSPRVIRID
jgi:hypothetical protein